MDFFLFFQLWWLIFLEPTGVPKRNAPHFKGLISDKYSRDKNPAYPPNFLIYILVCTAQTNKSMKTSDIPLKIPIKLQQEMQKKNFEFSKICKIFRAFFEKAVFLENGHGRH